jgi:hypothetical protein
MDAVTPLAFVALLFLAVAAGVALSYIRRGDSD